MQELRSTDILDKEIQSDARKKAEKILRKADSDCENLLASVDENIQKAKAEKESFYANKLADFEKDQKAFFPLEKKRFEVSFVNDQILKNIDAYIGKLSAEKKLGLVCKNYDFKSDKKVNAFVYGFDIGDAKKFLESKLGKKLLSCRQTQFGKIIIEDDCGLKTPEGIILEAEDKSFRVSLTMSEILSHILDENREELFDTLFGGHL